MRTILVFALVSLGFVSCGDSKDQSNQKSKPNAEETFSLAPTNDQGWVRIKAYGHSFLYPDSKESIKEEPMSKERWPITIMPYLAGQSHHNETVKLFLTLNGAYDPKECTAAENNPAFKSLQVHNKRNIHWAGVRIQNSHNNSGSVNTWIHASYRTTKGCTHIFLYDSSLEGIAYKLNWDDQTKLMQTVRKVLQSYKPQ
jgi:hypothetical protein